jgi:hypothetical protein
MVHEEIGAKWVFPSKQSRFQNKTAQRAKRAFSLEHAENSPLRPGLRTKTNWMGASGQLL